MQEKLEKRLFIQYKKMYFRAILKVLLEPANEI